MMVIKYMIYNNLSDYDKKELLKKEYEQNKLSFADIANKFDTYSNKLRRDAIKFKIKVRDKSEAQKNALSTGKIKHPTQNKQRSEEVKDKIGIGVLNSWNKLDEKSLKQRKLKSKKQWEQMDEDLKDNILRKANEAVRESSKKGSKLEKYLMEQLLIDGYKVDFHKEQILSNTKLQIDLFLPQLNVAIEVDGPSHFKPVWGQDNLNKNKKYDNKKNGLILGKGLYLIRIEQHKDFSKTRSNIVYKKLLYILQNLSKQWDNRTITIGDE